jgi:hypothetical protein
MSNGRSDRSVISQIIEARIADVKGRVEVLKGIRKVLKRDL